MSMRFSVHVCTILLPESAGRDVGGRSRTANGRVSVITLATLMDKFVPRKLLPLLLTDSCHKWIEKGGEILKVSC